MTNCISNKTIIFPIRIIFIFFTIFFIYTINFLSAEYSDDFVYKFIIVNGLPDYAQPIKCFSDIIHSQIDHYYTWNGRTITHIFVQLFSGLCGKSVFDFFNTIIFCIFILLIKSEFHNDNEYNNLFVYPLIVSLVFLLPEPNLTFFWMTGSINYLWTATITLCFLKLFENFRERLFSKPFVFLLIPIFFMGWTHEAITFPIAFSTTLICLLDIKKSYNTAGFWIAFVFLIGACMSAFAPATISRAGVHESLSLKDSLLKVISSLIVLSKLRIIYITLIVIIYLRKYHFHLLKSLIKDNSYLLFAILPALGIVIASGLEASRTAFGLELFCMIFLLRMVARVIKTINYNILNRVSILLIMVISIFYGFVFYHAYQTWRETQQLITQINNNTDGIIGTNEHDSKIFSSFIRTMIMRDDQPYSMYYDSHNFFTKNIAATYNRDSLIFLPQKFIREIRFNPNRYAEFDMDSPYEFFVKKIGEAQIDSVFWQLNPTDFSKIPFFYRPIAKRLGRYVDNVSECNKWTILYLYGQRYLIVKKAHAWDKRLKGILVIEKETAKATDDQYQKAA